MRYGLIFLMSIYSPGVFADTAGQNGDVFYSTGQAQSDRKLAAEKEACDSAKRELIGYIFGLSTKVMSNVIQVQDMTNITQSIDADSDWLHLISLKQNVISEFKQDQYIATCHLQYPVPEANKEKKRIERARNLLDKQKLNRANFEHTDPVRFGRLTVRSNVSKAKVFLDGVFWGSTPLEIDRVPLGKHQLITSAEAYVSDSQEITMDLGENKQIFITLTKNFASLEIMDLPPGAKLWINGIKVPSGQTHPEPGDVIIRAEAPFYHPYQDRISINPGARLQHSISMTAKAVPVSFISKGEKADVYVNGTKHGSTPLIKEFPVGSYTVDFMTSAGILYSQSLMVVPGGKVTVTAPAPKKTQTTHAHFSSVVLYKDASLSVRKNYSSFREIPNFSGKTASVSFEMMEPKNAFIYVNGTLAGKHAIVIDDVALGTVIKVESAGYYSSEFQIRTVGEEFTSTLDQQILKVYGGIENNYKIFMFRKMPQFDKHGVTLAIGKRAQGTSYNLSSGEVVGIFQDLDKAKELSIWSDASANIIYLDASTNTVPALAIQTDFKSVNDALDGQVTDIQLSDPDAGINANQIFPGSSSNLSSRTIFVGHAYFLPTIDRSHHGSSITFGAPFAVKKLELQSKNTDVANAKRYSP